MRQGTVYGNGEESDNTMRRPTEQRLSEYEADFIPAFSSQPPKDRVFHLHVHVGQASFSIDEVVVQAIYEA